MKAHTREFDEWYSKIHTKEVHKKVMTASSGASGKHSQRWDVLSGFKGTKKNGAESGKGVSGTGKIIFKI